MTRTPREPPQVFHPPNCDDEPIKKLWLAYLLALSPLGIFGTHHYYLGRRRIGIFYSCTAGLLAFGWIVDLIRMTWVVRRANRETRLDPPYLDDAYLTWFPLGLFGLHRFYLKDTKIGLIYLFTISFAGFGWLFDSCFMDTLINALEEDTALEHAPGGEISNQGRYSRTGDDLFHIYRSQIHSTADETGVYTLRPHRYQAPTDASAISSTSTEHDPPSYHIANQYVVGEHPYPGADETEHQGPFHSGMVTLQLEVQDERTHSGATTYGSLSDMENGNLNEIVPPPPDYITVTESPPPPAYNSLYSGTSSV